MADDTAKKPDVVDAPVPGVSQSFAAAVGVPANEANVSPELLHLLQPPVA